MRPWAALFAAFARMRLANMYTIACNAFAQNHSKIPHPRAHSYRLSAAYGAFEHADAARMTAALSPFLAAVHLE